ncbi:MAG: phosphorylase, partial [Flavobacteriaceae bacterium]|nr:phosphorylase [Flavobacteriaceae bacterium]
MPIKESELILNPDGSVYHLNLKPENISENI